MERILEAGTVLYKCMDPQFDENYPGPCWFSLENTQLLNSYGSNMMKFKTTKPLRMINIASIQFHNLWIDIANQIGEQNEHARDMLLLPLGLPDDDTQKSRLRALGEKIPDYSDEHLKDIRNFGAYLQHHYRMSAYDTDNSFTDMIRQIFSDRDGILSAVQYPSLYPTICLFPKELCIFNIKDKVKQIGVVKGGSIGGKRKKGGSPVQKLPIAIRTYPDNMTSEEWNKVREELNSAIGIRKPEDWEKYRLNIPGYRK